MLQPANVSFYMHFEDFQRSRRTEIKTEIDNDLREHFNAYMIPLAFVNERKKMWINRGKELIFTAN